MVTRILVPTDGSEQATVSVEGVFETAGGQDAAVHVLYVVDTRRYGEPALSSTEVLVDCLEDDGREHLRALAEEGARRDVTVEKHCRHGDPATEITLLADDLAVDLVVPCLSNVTPAQLRHQGLDSDRIAEARSLLTA